MKRAIRLCSIILVIAIFVNMLPMQVLGEMVQSSLPAPTESTEKVQTEETKSAQIVYEVVENRTEFSKEHVLSNGLHMMTLYPDAIHYETDDGWEEIDNTLKSGKNGTYTNTAGVWDVSLPQQLSAEKPITITKDGYTLSFAMAGQLRLGSLQVAAKAATGEMGSLKVSSAKTAAAQIRKADNSALKEAMDHPQAIPDTLTSRLEYENVYANTDVLYDLDSNKVKESIVLQAYDSALRGYRYALNVGQMIPVLEEDGQVTFYTPDRKDVVMVMPAPFLVDDANKYSYDVQVQLTGSGSSYTLTYLLPQTWLADSQRQWPVVLDPVINADFEAKNIQDHTVASKRTYSYTWGMGAVGYDDSYGAERFFIKYNVLPSLSAADVVVGATMQLCMDEHGENTSMQVHKVKDTWSSTSLTWANQPDFEETAEDYAILDEPGYYGFIVTDIVQDWYAGENTGMVFRFSDAIEEGTTDNWIQFYSSDYGTNKPFLSVVFRNAAGLESYWDYTETSAGRAGTGYVNNYSGNLVFTKSDMGYDGNRMPVSITHVYNANDAYIYDPETNGNKTSLSDRFDLGFGWRTNYHQRVGPWSQDDTYYVWTDGDGTKHYFKQKGSTVNYEDEDGLELTLVRTGTGESKACYIEDKYGNRSYFDSVGRLVKIQNNQATKSSIKISYDTNGEKNPRISKIEDGIDRAYNFVYAGGRLSRIDYTGKGTTVIDSMYFYYDDNGNLTKIKDIDGGENTYTYTSKNLLTSAIDPSKYKIAYAYNTTTTKKPSRVTTIEEFDDGTAGGKLTVTYEHNQTTLTDHDGNAQIMQFNDFGNTVSVQDGEGHAQYAKYALNTDAAKANNTDSTKRTNQLRVSSKLQNTVGNRLKNNSFEGTNVWTAWPDSAEMAQVSNQSYLGSKSLHLKTTESSYLLSPDFTIEKGATYTFSAYIRGVTGKTEICLENRDTGERIRVPATDGSNGWVRYEVSYTNKSSAAITAKAEVRGLPGAEAYIDCVQVEKANSASRFNLVDNGDFTFSGSPAYSWTGTNINASTDKRVTEGGKAAPQLDTGKMKIVGVPKETRRVTQTIAISGKAGDSYVLSGWAKGNSTPLERFKRDGGGDDNLPDRLFALRVKFNYTDGESRTYQASFNPDTNEWQYSAVAAVAKKAYSSIEVYLACDYNLNTFYFDGIQLYKEEFGTSYTYDEEGNVISVVDLQKQTTTYEYFNNNLTNEILPSGAELIYTYDDYHNVTSALTPYLTQYTFQYDKWGNNTQVTESQVGGALNMFASAAYSDDGNRLESTTNTLGKTTKYHYTINTGILQWVQYPKDTVGTNGTEDTRTKYTYDELYRTATAAAKTNTGLDLSAKYTYAEDNLTKIETPRTTYDFTYGKFSLRSKVSIGSRTLASYSYTSENHDLSKLTYGNGDWVSYTYDKQGRVTEQAYENGDTVTYQYNNDGDLAKVKDSSSGITTTYFYDLTGRTVKYVESGADHSHTVGYTYDEKNNLSTLKETIDGSKKTTSYTYDDENKVTSVTNGASKKTTDYEGSRIAQQDTTHNGSGIKSDVYGYNGGTMQVTSHRIEGVAGSPLYEYTYDANGNVTKINHVLRGEITYKYDTANQLIRENNELAGYTHTWEYDDAGNILNRKEYPYTTGTLGTPIKTVVYTYGNSSWGDLLTAYDGNTITYDQIGNQLTDGKGRNNSWNNGRELIVTGNPVAIYIRKQPTDFSGLIGDEISFSVTASGEGLTYQWQVSTDDGNTWSDSTGSGYNTATIDGFDVTEARNGRLYRCVITDKKGNAVISKAGEIIAKPIMIDTQPQDFYGDIGEEISFSVSARGSGLTYQWQVSANGGNTWSDSTGSGYNTATLDGFDVTEARLGRLYRCKIVDSKGNVVYSKGGEICLNTLTITKQPSNFKGLLGDEIVFSVKAKGKGLTYQWQYTTDYGATWYNSTGSGYNTRILDGFPITLTRDGRFYRCKVTDENGNVAYSGEAEIVLVTEGWYFEYDANGMRTQRTDGDTTYRYVYNGDQLSQMTKGTDTLRFSYDAAGLPMTLTHNGTVYYYATNLQGDVIAIVNSSGDDVVRYTYDAWGNPLSVTGAKAATLGQLNPLRYRGYVYDTETGLYYLQSRYYDPEMGRFINADGLISTGQGLLGNNMFAYCGNSPVLKHDSLGMWTMGISIGGNVTAYFGASISIGIFWDDNWNFDWQWSYSVVGVNNTCSIGALDAGIGLSLQYTNRDSVSDLHGPASYIGASGGPSWYVGADLISFDDISDIDLETDGFQVTAGLGVGIDIHVVESYTNPVGRDIRGSYNKITFKEKRLGRL